jgi:DNA-binding response OmpR family regulator
MKNIFVVEDEETSFRSIEHALSPQFNIIRAKTVQESRKILENIQPDLILLDLMLPDGDGFQVLGYIKGLAHLSDKPCMFLSSKGEVDNKVLGLKLGADDYLTKPIEPKELLARVENKISRYEKFKAPALLEFGNLSLNPETQMVSISKEGRIEDLSLTPIEFKILLQLTQNSNQVFSREDLIKKVWGNAIHIQPRNIDTHVNSIRKKLQDYGNSIESVYGSGYRFNPNIVQRNYAS